MSIDRCCVLRIAHPHCVSEVWEVLGGLAYCVLCVAERERKEKLAAELLATANDKGLAQLRLECLERRMAESAARQAGMEAQLAQLRVATAAAEAGRRRLD